MLAASRARILETLADDALVLDVGGWAKPFARADWVLDLMPHASRGLYGYDQGDRAQERFRAETWVQRDICAREPWPFADGEFDFAICSHTLEDVRDPVRVAHELARVARAGYVEVPSRFEEQAWGVQGEWAGWGHHHWLCDVDQDTPAIEFVFKPHGLHGDERFHVPHEVWAASSPEQRVQPLWWQDGFAAGERVLYELPELVEYLQTVAAPHRLLRRRGLRSLLA